MIYLLFIYHQIDDSTPNKIKQSKEQKEKERETE